MLNTFIVLAAETAEKAAAAVPGWWEGQYGVLAIAIGAAVAIAVTGIATALVQKDVGSAAVGAMAENEKLFVKGLVLTALPETIVLFGFVIAIMLVLKIKG